MKVGSVVIFANPDPRIFKYNHGVITYMVRSVVKKEKIFCTIRVVMHGGLHRNLYSYADQLKEIGE